jgi:hypothetical protein
MVAKVGISRAITNLNEAHAKFNIRPAADPTFFTEWVEDFPDLSDREKQTLDHLKQRYYYYAADGAITEGTVNLILLSPLLEVLGLCDPPYKLRGEGYVRVAIDDGNTILEGYIDALVVKDRLWLILIEGRRYGFSVMQALPQTLAYLVAQPDTSQPAFAAITNGEDYMFVKFDPRLSQYDVSDKFTLSKRRENDLYVVAQIMKRLVD